MALKMSRRLVTVASEPAVNLRNPARRSLAGPISPPSTIDTMKRSSTYGLSRLDPEKEAYLPYNIIKIIIKMRKKVDRMIGTKLEERHASPRQDCPNCC